MNTTQQTCGTCRFQGERITAVNEEGIDSPTRFFLCTRILHCDRHTHRVLGNNGGLDETAAKAFVEDGSDYYAALCVESDFGCVLWEQAPTILESTLETTISKMA